MLPFVVFEDGDVTRTMLMPVVGDEAMGMYVEDEDEREAIMLAVEETAAAMDDDVAEPGT